MDLTPDHILKYITEKADRPMKLKELAKALDISDDDYPEFRRTVKTLMDEGKLVLLKRNRIGIAQELNVVVGKVSINRSGTGFLMREGIKEDLLIPQWYLGTALDGDKVMARLGGQVNGRASAQVIRIIERSGRNIVGVFRKSRAFNYIEPDNPRIHRDLYIPSDATLDAVEGEKVVGVLTKWDDPHLNPEGEIVERLGYPGDPGVDMLTVMRTFNLPEAFPPEVVDEAEEAAAAFEREGFADRLDLRKDIIYTIDPVDAKDHDDAVSVERTELGYKLGVHIADVSHFVTEGSALDREAFLRGNSVYFPGSVIPMIPETLSTDVCSLKPHKPRLAFTIFINFDRKGRMLDWQLANSVIESKAKLTYEQVQEFFETGVEPVRTKKVCENLTVARELAKILTKRRFEEGSLDFDLPESKIVMNAKGEVLELGHRVRLESHRLVEEFMLAANRAVALEVFRNAQPFLYRVHDRPDFEKLEAFSMLVARLGYKFPVSPNMRPIQFNQFLEEIKSAPEAEFLNELLLRSMAKAVYQRANIGHFGLAFSHYTHFTSPIRRYPDLIVHRLLRKLKNGKYAPTFAKRVEEFIDAVGKHCSETERTAEQAERQAIRVKQVSFMANHLGEEYTGVISGVVPYGFFVRLDNMGVEGMVRFSSIDDDYYVFDEAQYRVVGRRRHRIFRLGDPIKVGVQKVDKTRNEIDLFVVEALAAHGKAGKGRTEAVTLPKSKPEGLTKKGWRMARRQVKRKAKR